MCARWSAAYVPSSDQSGSCARLAADWARPSSSISRKVSGLYRMPTRRAIGFACASSGKRLQRVGQLLSPTRGAEKARRPDLPGPTRRPHSPARAGSTTRTPPRANPLRKNPTASASLRSLSGSWHGRPCRSWVRPEAQSPTRGARLTHCGACRDNRRKAIRIRCARIR